MAALKPYKPQYIAAALPKLALSKTFAIPSYGVTTLAAQVGIKGERAVLVRIGKCARIIAWQIPALPPG